MNRRRLLVGVAIGGALLTAAVMSVSLAPRWFATARDVPPMTVGAPAPRFTASTLDAVPRVRTLDDYRGRPVLLNVWATWCDPCRDEMPSLQTLQETFGARGLRVVAVSIDDPGSAALIREFATAHKLTFDLLLDDKASIMSQYQVRGVPESFLISATGVIRGRRFAADWTTAESRKMIEQLLF